MKLEDITKYWCTYVEQNIRRDQEYQALFECLIKTMSAYAKNKIMVWSTQFNILGVYSVVRLLKVIIW